MYRSCASKRSCRVLIQGLGSRRSQACSRGMQGRHTPAQAASGCLLPQSKSRSRSEGPARSPPPLPVPQKPLLPPQRSAPRAKRPASGAVQYLGQAARALPVALPLVQLKVVHLWEVGEDVAQQDLQAATQGGSQGGSHATSHHH